MAILIIEVICIPLIITILTVDYKISANVRFDQTHLLHTTLFRGKLGLLTFIFRDPSQNFGALREWAPVSLFSCVENFSISITAEKYNEAAEAAMGAMKGRMANKYFALAEELWAECDE